MNIGEFALRSLRKINKIVCKEGNHWRDNSQVEYFGQAANDYVRTSIENSKNGLMIAKFGTIELNSICCCKRVKEGLKISDYFDYIKGKGCIYPHESLKGLNINAGFFPASEKLQYKFTNLIMEDIKYMDILGSYINQESYLSSELQHCKKIDVDGYCAPFVWENAWTRALKNKKVLIVHPFVESIKKQYEKRKYLFSNDNILPEFDDLILIKAVQSIAGNGARTEFENWFEALRYMENQIDASDYDVALIGCGAYGMPLTAHCKRKGKIAIHLAGWTQMLFGIYGNRWIEDQPEYAKYINEYWTRPTESEKPDNLELVENGAYW